MNIYFTNGTWAGKLVIKGIIIVEALAAAVIIIIGVYKACPIVNPQ